MPNESISRINRSKLLGFLRSVDDALLLPMMGWFSSEEEVLDWAGPNFSYPYDAKSFRQDLKLEKFNSFALVSDEGDLLAFGQYYLRLGQCHLARLAVAPIHRRKGIVFELIDQLSKVGMQQLDVEHCSLFVFWNNTGAISAYEKHGFRVVEYPEQMPLEKCLYMVK